MIGLEFALMLYGQTLREGPAPSRFPTEAACVVERDRRNAAIRATLRRGESTNIRYGCEPREVSR